MNCNLYEVEGVYRLTKQKRKINVYAKTIEHAKLIATQQDFVEPLTISEKTHEPPTEQQIDYANNLGISIPNGASKKDVSTLISRKLEHENDPNPGLYEFADNHGLVFSKYIGEISLYNLIFEALDIKDKIAFFCFSVYRFMANEPHSNLDTCPFHDEFYSFADRNVTNPIFVKSLNKYRGKDLRFFGKMNITEANNYLIADNGGSVTTIAYQITDAFLKDCFGF